MAQVISPVAPDVSAEMPKGNDYQNIETNPNMFGGAIAAGEEKLGQGLDQVSQSASEYAQKQINLFNEANVNDAFNQYLDGRNKVLYASPSAPDADDGGFFTKRGDAAFVAKDQAQQQFNDVRDSIRTTLPNQKQQVLFDSLTRRMHAFDSQSLQSHADQQLLQATDQKAQALIEGFNGVAGQAATSGNYDVLNHAIDQVYGTAFSQGKNRYGDEYGRKYGEQQVGHVVANVVEQMAGTGNLAGAQTVFSNWKDRMDPVSQLSVITKLKTQTTQAGADATARSLLTSFSGVPDTPANGVTNAGLDLGAVASKINSAGVEGTAKNPNSSAVGPGQFIDKTAIATARAVRPDFANESDADVLSYVRGHPDFQASLTPAYAAQNAQVLQTAGLPLTEGNIYLAHFAGPGGAVKVLSAAQANPDTPVSAVLSSDAIQANPRVLGGGATVGSVQQWATSQMAGAKPTAAVKDMKADGYQIGMNLYAGDPAGQAAFAQAWSRQTTGLQLKAQADELARKQAGQDAHDQYLKDIWGNKGIDLQALGNDNRVTPAEKESLQKYSVEFNNQKLNGDNKEFESVPGAFDQAQRDLASGKLATQQQILNLGIGQPGQPAPLKSAGVQRLMEYYGKSNTAQLQVAAFNSIKQQLGLTDLDTKDPMAATYWATALPHIYSAIDSATKAGIPPESFYNPESKDFIGNSVSVLKLTPGQIAQRNIDRGRMADMTKLSDQDLGEMYWRATPHDQQMLREEAQRRGKVVKAEVVTPPPDVPLGDQPSTAPGGNLQ